MKSVAEPLKSKTNAYISLALLFTLILAIFLRIDYEVNFLDFYADKAYLTFAAENLIKGYGVSIVHPDINDLSKNIIYPLVGTPPAYSYLLSFFHPWLSLVNASVLIDSVAIVILLLSVLSLSHQLKIKREFQILIFLFFAFTPSPFGYLNSTDLIVSSLTVFNVALFMLLYRKSYTWFFLFSIFTFLPLIFKYSAYPFAALAPSVLLLIGYLSKKKEYYLKASINVTVTLLLLLSYTFFFPDYPQEKAFEQGYYPENLLRLDDFIFKSFFYIEFFITGIVNSNQWIYLISRIAFIATSLGIFSLIAYNAYKSLKINSDSKEAILHYFVVIVNVLLVGAYSYLSLTAQAETWQDPPWTYVEETRYYAAAMFLIQFTFLLYLSKSVYSKTIKDRLISAFVGTSILFSIVYGMKQEYNLHIKEDNQYTYASNFYDELKISSTIDALETMDANNDIIYASSDPWDGVFIATHSKVDKFMDLGELLETKKTSSEPVTLIINCNEQELLELKYLYENISLTEVQPKKNSFLCTLNLASNE